MLRFFLSVFFVIAFFVFSASLTGGMLYFVHMIKQEAAQQTKPADCPTKTLMAAENG